MQTKSTAKYEKKLQELTTQCQLKTKECYEAWMSLTAANEELDKVMMDLDNVTFRTLSQGMESGSLVSKLSELRKFLASQVTDNEKCP